MAHETWLTTSPKSGSGNGTISNSASQHTGRVQRSTVVTVTPSAGNAKTYTVNQTAAPESITVAETGNVAYSATTYSVSGTTNTTKINWTIEEAGTLSPTVPTSYTANGASTNNNTAISGDPGAKAQFSFSGNVTFSANSTINARTGKITLTAGAGGTGLVKTITITQAAGPSTLSISPTSATYAAAGERKPVAVTTNSSWTSSSTGGFLSANPASGGQITTQVTANAHTGRNNRTGTVVFKVTAGGETSATYSVTQTGKAEFVTWAQSSYTAVKRASTVTMTGTSNSSKLTFAVKAGGGFTPTINASYTANGSAATNGTAISGDPGGSAQFIYIISVSVPANTTIDTRSCVITATPNSGTAVEATINQAAGDVVLDVSPTTITLAAAGTPAQTVNVSANVGWTVS